jgi:hypothetical protein
MYRALLNTQLKWQRLELATFSVIAFVLPVLLIRALSGSFSGSPIAGVLDASGALGVPTAMIAFVTGVLLAGRPWLIDQASNHVLTLSLPVEWRRFVQLRFAAGATLILIPSTALLLGGLFAAAALPIPDTLHAYPLSFATRFAAATLISYAITFFFQYAFGRRAPMVFAGLLVALLAAEGVSILATDQSFLLVLWRAVSQVPGPLEALTARWMLVDV